MKVEKQRNGIASVLANSITGTGMAFILLLVLYFVLILNQPSALTSLGIENILNNAVALMLAATGLTFIILIGELDLSGAGIVVIANVVVAMTSDGFLGITGSLLLVIVIGIAIGLLNGFLVARVGLQSLAATLGTLIICQGVALIILPAPGGLVADGITYGLTGNVLGIPVALLTVILVACAWMYFKRTPAGIHIYAIGGDSNASELSGIPGIRTKNIAFAFSGLFYALAGFYLSAQTGSGDPRVNDVFLLMMFASVAIGGTSLSGGAGGVVGSILGAGILTVMQSMLFALGVSAFYTNILSGIVMILAIYFGLASNTFRKIQISSTQVRE